MIDPRNLARDKHRGAKARAVRERMDKLRAERNQSASPGPELFELCAECGRPLAHWYWRPVAGSAPLKLEKVCADCVFAADGKPKGCKL
jgi:hypothetical protein